MKSSLIKYIFISLLLIALQLLVFNQVILRIGQYFFIPYVYILAIMLFPFETKQEQILPAAFFIGLIIDILSGTLALHTAASVVIAFFRRNILTLIAPRMGYTQGTLPSYLFYGIGWFVKYALIMTFVHHFWFYLWDVFSLKLFPLIIYKSVINALYSTVMIVLLHYVFKNRPTLL